MGVLVSIRSEVSARLRVRTLVGRDARADLLLTSSGTSGQHALIRWDGSHWFLRDLSSRNGTSLNDVPLQGRESVLHVNDVLVFGDPVERWRVADVQPPTAFALRADGGTVEGTGDTLLLPDETNPRVGLYRGEQGWALDSESESKAVADGDSVELDGVQYRLSLPGDGDDALLTKTFTARPRLASICMEVDISADQEFLQIRLSGPGVFVELPSRACSQVLALLAQWHDEDRAAGFASAEQGWRYADDVARKLGSTLERLNVDIHRVRRMVSTTEVFADPDQIVQRRRTTGQIRLGAGTVSTRRIGQNG